MGQLAAGRQGASQPHEHLLAGRWASQLRVGRAGILGRLKSGRKTSNTNNTSNDHNNNK